MAIRELEKGRDEISQIQGQVHGDVVVCISVVSHPTLPGATFRPF